MPSIVMILRHAEKPLSDGPPHGITVDGTQDAESLTPRGWQRAGALVAMFTPAAAAVPSRGLPSPTHLLASQVGPQSHSQRPRQTLLPLAERLGLPVDSRFRKEEVDQLVQAVRELDGIVLIAWEHHVIPSIANMLLGDTSTAPQVWPDDRYDVVWVIEFARPGGRAAFREVPEMLLAGDQPRPIAHQSQIDQHP